MIITESDTMAKKNKYNAIKTTTVYGVFDSRGEAERYSFLKLCEKAGIIKDLSRQIRYDLICYDTKICAYILDHKYIVCATGKVIHEDFKGVQTSVFRIKKNLMKACHNIDVKIVKSVKKDPESL